jgi:hypothetical protein
VKEQNVTVTNDTPECFRSFTCFVTKMPPYQEVTLDNFVPQMTCCLLKHDHICDTSVMSFNFRLGAARRGCTVTKDLSCL